MTARLPDWAIYGAATLALLFVSLSGRERADAPEAPPPLEGSEDALIGPPARFERTISVDPASGPSAPPQATAFAVSATGRWVSAGRLARSCRKAAVLLGGGQALQAQVTARDAGTSELATDGAATALPFAPPASLKTGARGYAVGFPQGRPGELALRLIGRGEIVTAGHGHTRQPVLIWAQVGRTHGLEGRLVGLDGGPVLDSEGRVAGVVLKEELRRGRLYTATPDSLAGLAKARTEPAPGEPLTGENYGRAADTLRRDLRVAEVRCL